MTDHQRRKRRLLAALRRDGSATLGLKKSSSNLFRYRHRRPQSIDVRGFRHVLSVGPDSIEVEGMASYEEVVARSLPHGLMPSVVPELKSITVGGAAAGIGIESSSFRFGLVHEGVREMDVLLADGRIVKCRPDNEHADLFYAFPNSYGSFGYALRLVIDAVPVRPSVRIDHLRFDRPELALEALARGACASSSQADFAEGVVFGKHDLVISLGRFVAGNRSHSDYRRALTYHRSLRQRSSDYLSVKNYLWRWDTDWFWCSKHFGAQNPLVRLMLGRRFLCSTTWWRIREAWGQSRAVAWLGRLFGVRPGESVVQDVQIPIERCAEFLEFFHREVGILPIWMCPVRARDRRRWPLYALDPATLYVNFGFWDVVAARSDEGAVTRRIEQIVERLGGRKSLYSTSYYDRETFDRLYGGAAYRRIKERYDSEHRLPELYDKSIGRA